MAEIKVPFKNGWIQSKDDFNVTENFSDIFKFYVLGNPCDYVTSSGIPMTRRGWKKDVWKKSDLRNYMLETAKLRNNVTFKKVTKVSEMSAAASSIGLDKSFHTKRDVNRILMYSDGRRPDILAIIYYVRCAIAHGRFERYETDEGIVYAFEAITKKRGSSDYIVRARMVLFEKTLIEWKNIIINGSDNFEEKKCEMENTIRVEIKTLIQNNVIKKKNEISNALPYEDSEVFSQLKKLTTDKEVKYDNSERIWKLLNC